MRLTAKAIDGTSYQMAPFAAKSRRCHLKKDTAREERAVEVEACSYLNSFFPNYAPFAPGRVVLSKLHRQGRDHRQVGPRSFYPHEKSDGRIEYFPAIDRCHGPSTSSGRPLLAYGSPSSYSRRLPKGRRQRINDRAAFTGTLFVLNTEIPWKYLPHELGFVTASPAGAGYTRGSQPESGRAAMT
jgi:hypothetical protein